MTASTKRIPVTRPQVQVLKRAAEDPDGIYQEHQNIGPAERLAKHGFLVRLSIKRGQTKKLKKGLRHGFVHAIYQLTDAGRLRLAQYRAHLIRVTVKKRRLVPPVKGNRAEGERIVDAVLRQTDKYDDRQMYGHKD